MCNVMRGHGASPLGYGVAGPKINLDGLEDETYVALEQPKSKDEEMESDSNAHIWLEDVEHLTSSRTPRSRRR